MPNRKRNKAINLRMTEEEYVFFQDQYEKSEMKNQTDFFLAVLRNKPITVIEDLKPMLVELKRQGNNLNQIARALNEFGGVPEDSLKGVLRSCYAAYRALLALEVD